MAQHIVALDLGERTANVAVIAATFRRAELVKVASVTYEPGQELPAILARIKEVVGVPIDSLVCSFAGQRASVRALTFPFGDTKRAQAAVQFELEGQVPYALEDVILSWLVVDRTPKTLRLLAAVTPKAPLLAQLQGLARSKLDPRAIMHPAVALAELLPQRQGAAHEPASAALSLGNNEAHLCVVRNGLRAIRTLRFAVQGSEQLAGDGAWGPLVAGVLTTLKGLDPADRPKTLFVTGPAAQHPELVDQLRTRLGVDVAPLDLVAASGRLNVNQRIDRPQQAIVLGMAMSLVRHGKDVPLNFRTGELAYRGDIQLYRGQLVRVALGLLVVFGLTMGNAAVRWMALAADEEVLNKRFCEVTERVIGKEVCDPAAALATLRQPAGASVAIPGYSATALAEMMSVRLGPSVDVTFDDMDVRVDATPGQPDRIMARGEAATFETTDQLVGWLKSDVCVQDAEVSKQRKSGNGRVEFSLVVKVMCPLATLPGRVVRQGGQAAGAKASGPQSP